ncbi:hypothetical protein ACWGLP_17975 [Streptomyces lydicus]
MDDICTACNGGHAETYHFPGRSGRREATRLCYRCALRRGAPNLDDDVIENMVRLATELRMPRPVDEPQCRVCKATEGLQAVLVASNSGPGWRVGYCGICISLPPAPDLESHAFDQLLAHAEGVWSPGAAWPPRPRPHHP